MCVRMCVRDGVTRILHFLFYFTENISLFFREQIDLKRKKSGHERVRLFLKIQFIIRGIQMETDVLAK